MITAVAPATITERLEAAYGPQVWSQRREPLHELVVTCLAQHTSDLNAERAYAALWARYASWAAIDAAPVEEVIKTIWSGGLAPQKGPRIKAILERLRTERGDYDLSFLGERSIPDGLAWLTAIPGIGPKTARCVLLFSLAKPVIPVDTHVHRVSRRLGLIGPKTSAEDAHAILEAQVAPEDAYRYHMCLILHGRRTCKAQRPLCGVCPLNDVCPWFLAAGKAAGEAEADEE
ncbi:MAG: endonuclease III [Chloroflexi bacterium]|nr:endonuclease III [Chloroflexota bacterium]